MLLNLLKIKILALVLTVVPTILLAEQPIYNPMSKDPNMTLVMFLQNIVKGVSYIAVPIIVLVLVYAGFLFVTTMGSADKLKKAKHVLGFALLGAVLLLSASVLLEVVQQTAEELM